MGKVKAGDLKEGDLVDLQSCPHLNDVDWAEFEMGTVYETHDHGLYVMIGYENIGGLYHYEKDFELEASRTERLVNPTPKEFDAAYEKLTGSKPVKGRSAKVFRTMSSASNGRTVFGTCEVVWDKDDALVLTIQT